MGPEIEMQNPRPRETTRGHFRLPGGGGAIASRHYDPGVGTAPSPPCDTARNGIGDGAVPTPCPSGDGGGIEMHSKHTARNRQQGARGRYRSIRLNAAILPHVNGFTLIEVMIALGIFFAAVFTILALVSQILRNARGLQRPQVDAGMAAALYVNTNRFPEGTVSGDLGDPLADYSYEIVTDEFATNGLMQADIVLSRRGGGQPADTLSILVFDPNHQSRR